MLILDPKGKELHPILSDGNNCTDTNSIRVGENTSINDLCTSSNTGHLEINLNPHAAPFVPQTLGTEFFIETMDSASDSNSDVVPENNSSIRDSLFYKNSKHDEVLTILKDLESKIILES